MLKHLRSRTTDKNLLEKGFTLVELLVVIVILGILAAVVVFAVGGTTKEAAVNACLAERSTVESAVEAWRAQADEHGATPNPSMSDLLTGLPAAGTLAAGTPYLKHPAHYWDVIGGNLSRLNTNSPPVAKCSITT